MSFNFPQIYSGEANGPFGVWARRFRDYIECNPKLSEDAKIGRLKIYLDGTPRQYLEELEPALKLTLDSTLTSLEKIIDSPIRSQLAQQSLALCHQNEEESIDRFVERLVPLINASYPEQAPQLRKQLLKDSFLRKIRQEIAFYVQIGIAPEHSFEEVRSKAIGIENLIGLKKRKQANDNPCINAVSYHSNFNASQAPHHALNNHPPFVSFESHPSSLQPNFPPTNHFSCWNCGEFGHKQYECPENQQTSSSHPDNNHNELSQFSTEELIDELRARGAINF
jgi:hypothetical protein